MEIRSVERIDNIPIAKNKDGSDSQSLIGAAFMTVETDELGIETLSGPKIYVYGKSDSELTKKATQRFKELFPESPHTQEQPILRADVS